MTRSHRKGWLRTIIGEYFYFFRTYRMWWLIPAVLVMILLGGLVVISGTQSALLIYALF